MAQLALERVQIAAGRDAMTFEVGHVKAGQQCTAYQKQASPVDRSEMQDVANGAKSIRFFHGRRSARMSYKHARWTGCHNSRLHKVRQANPACMWLQCNGSYGLKRPVIEKHSENANFCVRLGHACVTRLLSKCLKLNRKIQFQAFGDAGLSVFPSLFPIRNSRPVNRLRIVSFSLGWHKPCKPTKPASQPRLSTICLASSAANGTDVTIECHSRRRAAAQ